MKFVGAWKSDGVLSVGLVFVGMGGPGRQMLTPGDLQINGRVHVHGWPAINTHRAHAIAARPRKKGLPTMLTINGTTQTGA